MNKRTWLLLLVAVVLLTLVGLVVKRTTAPTFSVPSEVIEPTKIEPKGEQPKVLTDWERNADRLAEDAIAAGTTLYLKAPAYIKAAAGVHTCHHIVSKDKTAIITLYYNSDGYRRGMQLPVETPLIVEEVVLGAKPLANGTMIAGRELLLRISTPAGHRFDLLYDVGENMKGTLDCKHTGKANDYIRLRDLDKMFTVGKFVVNKTTIITNTGKKNED